ncbi:MAG: XcyI family restriction endonuclease [Anaerolineae bacterium]
MPSSDSERKMLESWLLDQVTKSEFFHQKLHEYGLLEIAYTLESVRGEGLDWNLKELGISEKAWNRVIHRGLKPVRIFAHPYVLQTIERSVGYYRGLALVSRKSMSNIKLSIERFETGTNRRPLDEKKAQAVACRLNELISRLIEVDDRLDAREFDLWRGMTAGSTAQGSWQNKKGDVAEDLVKGFIKRRIRARGLVAREADGGATEVLADGRTVRYGSEPDIAIYKGQEILAAVEIKGGIDSAGVLERVGAAVKSLSRAKNENSNATTMLVMYRVALTEQAQQDLGDHRDAIDYWFTIEDVLNRDETRQQIFRLLGI